jgi:hypothetical protein
MWAPSPEHPVRRLFAGLTEHAFLTTLGVTDPPLVDYLSTLLTRFLHMDAVYRLRDGQGERIEDVPEMIREAEQLPAEGRTRREYLRHIGDFTLFWTGLYPETVQRLQTRWARDAFVSYCMQGKRAYYIASTFEGGPFRDEAPILRRLSEGFEMCAYGLNQVRKEFDALQDSGDGRLIG